MFTRLLSIVLIIVALLLLAAPVPVLAQEATPAPGFGAISPPLATTAPDAPPVVIVTPPVDASNDTILVVGVVGLLLLNIGILIFRGGNPDTVIADRLTATQTNREAMAAQERAYDNASLVQQRALDTLADVLRAIAPITPIRADDALVEYLDDVRTPGAPATEPGGEARRG